MNANLIPANKEVKLSAWFSEAMQLTLDNIGPHLLIGLILLVIGYVLSFTFIGILLLQVPLLCGMFCYAKKRMLRQPAEIGDLFRGFDVFVPALIASLIVTVVIVGVSVVVAIPSFIIGLIGAFCPFAFLAHILVYPVVLVISLAFLGPFFAMHALLPGLLFEQRMDGVEAIKLSYAYGWQNIRALSVYGLAVMAVVILGSLLTCSLGAIFTIPFMMFAGTVVYRDWIGFNETEGATAVETQTMP
jgi:uncharacterized membrane protein